MKFSIDSKAPKAELLLISLFKGEDLSSAQQALIGKDFAKAFAARRKAKDFEGEKGQSLTFYPEKGSLKKIIVLGRGDKEGDIPQANEYWGGTLSSLCKGVKNVAITLPEEELEEQAYGFVLGSYEFMRYKKEDKKAPKLESVTFLTKDSKKAQAFLKKLAVFQESSATLRDLTNMPAGEMSTKDLEDAARKVCKTHKMKLTVFDEKKLRKMGCGGLVGVGQGATHGPRMVLMEYKFKAKSKQPNLAFIGKGIVFDTGGLNIKPTNYIETMKHDMCGAATVIATMEALALNKVPGYFLGVLCCAENAVSDRSIHPGDVLTAYNGKTIEVTNTDAEGRLVLADGLSYTEKNFKPKAMLDVATLTGAVSVALGPHLTGVLGNDQAFMDEVLAASRATHELAWQLPLDAVFTKAMKGSFTDLVNSQNTLRAGTSTAGAFLKEFVGKTPWVHFDIGGTAWADRPTPTTKYGTTAVVLRTFVEMAERSY